MKKGQMEILGLVIIIILVMLGVLFAIRFVLQKPASNIEASIRESQLASNMLNAMLGTTTECSDATVTQLLQDCATAVSLRCPSGNSCSYAQSVINTMFDETFSMWNRMFHLAFKGSARIEALELGRACPGEFESTTRPIPTAGGGTISIRL